jgi:hypothetical protein
MFDRWAIAGRKGNRMRVWLTASWVVLSAILIAAAAYSQDANSPFGPVPPAQRKELANRLIEYTDAFRGRNWNSLYDLAADVNKKRSDGKRISRKTFGRLMKDEEDDWYQLLKFTPIRTEITPAGQFDVYGCGEFVSGEEKPERVAVAVRAVREHGAWFFTNWDYFDPCQPCSNLSDPAWKPSHYLRLEYLPEVVCVIGVCTL